MFLDVLELFIIIAKCMLFAGAYSVVALLILFLVAKTTHSHRAKAWLSNKFWFLLVVFHVFAIAFIVYSFSYWQHTGLGEHVQLPVGYGQRIKSVEFQWTYIFPYPDKQEINKDEFKIGRYKIKERFLCAEVSHEFSESPEYDFIVYDLKERILKPFTSEEEYMKYALANALPMPADMYDFNRHYYEFYHNRPAWRSWLLP